MRWTYESRLSHYKDIIYFAFENRHLKNAHAWVQDLDVVKSLKEEERPPFEINNEQAREFLGLPSYSQEVYIKLRHTIPEMEHNIAIKAAKKITNPFSS